MKLKKVFQKIYEKYVKYDKSEGMNELNKQIITHDAFGTDFAQEFPRIVSERCVAYEADPSHPPLTAFQDFNSLKSSKPSFKQPSILLNTLHQRN